MWCVCHCSCARASRQVRVLHQKSSVRMRICVWPSLMFVCDCSCARASRQAWVLHLQGSDHVCRHAGQTIKRRRAGMCICMNACGYIHPDVLFFCLCMCVCVFTYHQAYTLDIGKSMHDNVYHKITSVRTLSHTANFVHIKLTLHTNVTTLHTWKNARQEPENAHVSKYTYAHAGHTHTHTH